MPPTLRHGPQEELTKGYHTKFKPTLSLDQIRFYMYFLDYIMSEYYVR